ncbi:hypothetical protein [Paractinoplanes rishiriensis]|uniref:Secreted protein n=1 Tax=Paractinoplanes rishiriensis TaxID=1050105 RepID=A0A919JXT6_9ACTN|nr:hypothetical protein [Actinoplanes rishiriensis]GIE95485.1 hypothetical protein Ari01nite_29500 [Actinoplanes rishiriensis]
MQRLKRLLAVLTILAGTAAAAHLITDSRRPAPAAAPPAPATGYHSDGLSDSYDGFRAEPLALPAQRGRGIVSLRIVGPQGPVTDFQRVHLKPVHMYLLRDDLAGYQHLHPEPADGAWTAPVTITDGGAYRVYAEFVPLGRPPGADPTVLGVPFVIAGDTTMIPVPAPAATARSGPFTVRRLDGTADLASGSQAALQFQVTRSGRPVTLEPYLGAYAHLSNFEVRTQGLMHLHPLPTGAAGGPPADATLAFHAAFAERGDKRLFLQFQVDGVVHQAAFTIFAT